MPWTVADPPAVAINWTAAERRRCVAAANAVLADGGSDEDAIFACINAAGKGEETMKTKTYRAPLELKADGEAGEFSAVFSTFNVIDHDSDVTLPGAFGAQQVLIEPWNHNYQAPPVGMGAIEETEEHARVNGRFFLETAAGAEHHTVVKALGPMQEWSYTFRVLDAEPGVVDGQPVRMLKRMEVIGVSPVTRGAGINTRTLTIKTAGGGGNDTEDGDEGQAGDGEPSGPPPRVVSTAIDIGLMEV